jgi:glucose-1-phosphate thymidylyltransferase
MTRRGIILAGGAGTRLHPTTLATSKHLLPIYDKPMIHYPLTTLMQARIRDILIITTPTDQSAFQRLLGDGNQYGVRITYATQPHPAGIAQAIHIAEPHIRREPFALILGDNLYHGNLTETLDAANARVNGATVFAYQVKDPNRYGVVTLAADGKPRWIEEKPVKPSSPYAVTGLYFYDGNASELARGLQPSARGEYEITDLNNVYLHYGALHVEILPPGTAWLDTGTHESLLQASNYVQAIQERQGVPVGSPEATARALGWIP